MSKDSAPRRRAEIAALAAELAREHGYRPEIARAIAAARLGPLLEEAADYDRRVAAQRPGTPPTA